MPKYDDESILDTCVHSMVKPDCASCLRGEIHRMDRHIERLRSMILDLDGKKVLIEHDRQWFGRIWDPHSDVEMLEQDLPGMWSNSDFTGGATDMEGG